VNQFFMEQLAYLARKLDSHPRRRAHLAGQHDDHALLQHDGRREAQQRRAARHRPRWRGGRLKGGRVLDYKDKPERQLCRLFMSMMDKMNVRPKTFGDAKMMLEEV
jgi:hypothetical protein